ncbi:MAG: hypothetical protein ACK50E_07410 [Bacteroidota bacterium]|jgi:hypothetical protein
MRFIFLYLLLSLTVISNGQLVSEKVETSTYIGKVKSNSSILASLEYRLDDNKDTIYTLKYRNFKLSNLLEYETFTFKNDGNTINQFYDILKSFFTEENKKNKEYQVAVKFRDKSLYLFNWRNLGVTNVGISLSRYNIVDNSIDSGYCYLTEKQINKLFSREDNND